MPVPFLDDLPLHRPLSRRQCLGLAAAASLGLTGVGAGTAHAQTLQPRVLQFPLDHGSHPDTRIEWWYLTGHAYAGEQLWGFQVTFFRSKVASTQGMSSGLAAKQLLFVHAALTDVKSQKIYHDQRIARDAMPWARSEENDTHVHIRDWHLVRRNANSTGNASLGADLYTARIQSSEFSLELECTSSQPLLLQGQDGLSRKGPSPEHASFYYSQPQLSVAGHLVLHGKRMAIAPHSQRTPAKAWLDHEWSYALLSAQAVGWDWIGMNLYDGSALTAFRLRRADGSHWWAGGSYRQPGKAAQIFGAQDITFTPVRWWLSPTSGARYPVQWTIQSPAGSWTVTAMVDSQELDSRQSTGSVYWEGLSQLSDTSQTIVGMGYLEMTGYAQPLRL